MNHIYAVHATMFARGKKGLQKKRERQTLIQLSNIVWDGRLLCSCVIIDFIFFLLKLANYIIKSLCVVVCVWVRWVVGHLPLQAVCARPIGKVLFSLSSRGPQAMCGGYLFILTGNPPLQPLHLFICTHTQRRAKEPKKPTQSFSTIHHPVSQPVCCLTTWTQELVWLSLLLDTGGCIFHLFLSRLILHAGKHTCTHTCKEAFFILVTLPVSSVAAGFAEVKRA